MFAEIYDTIQAALIIWKHGDNVAAAGVIDQAILMATDAGDSELVNRLRGYRLDMESDTNREEYLLPMEPTDVLDPDLDPEERRLLRRGLLDWGGPARCTEEMAIAMGFRGVQDLFDSGKRLAGAIEAGTPLTAHDWLRVLLATEIVFASNTIGSGRDWYFTSGLTDDESLTLLRSVQKKLAGIGNLLGVAFGTLSSVP